MLTLGLHRALLVNQAAAVPFSPADIAGLGLWLDASAIVQSDATAVSSWTDRSGNGNNAVQASGGAQPTFNTSPARVTFDGSSDTLVSNLAITQPCSTFVVGTIATTLNSFCRFIGSNTGGPFLMGSQGAGPVNFIWFAGAAGVLLTDLSGSYKDAKQVWSAIFDGGDSSGRKNGAQVVAGDAGTNGNTQTSIGSNGASEYLQGSINEVLIYNSELTLAQFQAVEDYLGSKWSITISH